MGWAEVGEGADKRQPPTASADSLPVLSLHPSVPLSLHCPCTMGPASGPSLLLLLLLTGAPLVLGEPM